MDDGLIVGRSETEIKRLLDAMNKEFEITSSTAKYYLGIEIIRNKKLKKIFLSQKKYIKAVLDKFEMTYCKTACTPMEPGAILISNKDENGQPGPVANVPYRQIIGSLMHLAISTRPDISYAVSTLSQFLERPSNSHWLAAKRVLKYLKGIPDLGITFGGDCNLNNQLIAFSDSDCASCPNTRKSVSGIVLMLNNGPVAWSSRKQSIMATSTTDAEYVAMCEAAKEVVWTRRLLNELGIHQERATNLYCDNVAAKLLIENPAYHKRTKHIDIKFHYTREQVKNGLIKVNHIDSSNQLADILTKNLSRDKFKANCSLLKLM